MILQIRKTENYRYDIITLWADINHIVQILPSVDKVKLQEAINTNSKFNETDYFIQLKK